MNEIETVGNAIFEMEEQIVKTIEERSKKQLWVNTFIKKQIDRRERGEKFTINDHIRAMVYSMLSSGASWKRVLNCIDLETGKITVVDEIFFQYEPEKLLEVNLEDLKTGLSIKGLASQYTNNQIDVLKENIKTLQKIEKEYKTIDYFYSKVIREDSTKKKLVSELSLPRKPYKMKQLGFALTCEYLRNVGYDIPKPDRHICRILGKDYLALSEKQPVQEKEAFDIVAKLANASEKSVAETDYILWSYCANGYGDICTSRKPNCKVCEIKEHCNASDKK